MESRKIVDKMMEHDAFSQWLGIEVLETGAGYCRLIMTVRDEMVNGFGIAHGGICYSLADSALAFASNGHGQQSVSSETSIAHLEAVRPGMKLTAEAREIHRSRKLGHYEVRITSEEKLLALFHGLVYITSKEWNV